MQREKKTISGSLLEIDYYPVTAGGARRQTRAPKTKPSVEAQKKYNRVMAAKKLIRLVNANFDKGDLFLHPTYQPQNAPKTEEEARRDITNYMRRIKCRRESELKKAKKELSELKGILDIMPAAKHVSGRAKKLEKLIKKLSQPFRYIYVIEKQTYKTGALAGRANWHFHCFITGGLDRAGLEELWQHSINADLFRPDKFGPEAAARYIAKDPRGSKRFSCSRNLIRPKEKIRDGAISRFGVEQLAKNRIDDAAYWEKRYKGYKFIRCYARYNEYNGYWYVSAVMYKAEGDIPPSWKMDEWITSAFSA